jgi:hypothetical protein
MERKTKEDPPVARGCLGLDFQISFHLMRSRGFTFPFVMGAQKILATGNVCDQGLQCTDIDQLKGNGESIKKDF